MNKQQNATFFLSTGRCGTQWLAEGFGRVYDDLATTTHEPLHLGYRPRELYGIQDKTKLPANAELQAHANYILEQLYCKNYIETGWPCWSAIPFLAGYLHGRVKIVHLARHPVHTAVSWVSHGLFCPPLLPGIHAEKCWLSPFDQGIQLTGYRERWAGMTPYEKALFFWAELHNYGLRLEAELGGCWLRVRHEDLFSGNALSELLSFMGLPRRKELFDALGVRTDRFRYIIPQRPDLGAVRNHPDVIRTAAALGYDALTYDEEEIRLRYYPQL